MGGKSLIWPVISKMWAFDNKKPGIEMPGVVDRTL
jgi:hypothetical protein